MKLEVVAAFVSAIEATYLGSGGELRGCPRRAGDLNGSRSC